MCDGAGQKPWSYEIVPGVGWKTTDHRTTNSATKDFVYQNNFDGSLATLAYPSGRTITYSYDNAGRPTSGVDTANGIYYALNANYAAQGALASLQNGANIVSTFYYNNRLQPCRISVKSSGTAPGACSDAVNVGNVLDFTYGFNAGTANNGNVATIANNKNTARTQSFTYDELNRVKTAQTQATAQPHCWGETFTYDIWANLLTIGGIQPQYNGCTQESLSVGVTTKNQMSGVCYDSAGNLALNMPCPQPPGTPITPTYNYDAENRMTSTAGVNYTYDGDGKRVKKDQVSGSTYDRLYWYGVGSGALEESNLSGAASADFIFFDGERTARLDLPGGAVHYYFANQLGSANVVTSAIGVIQEESDYYPFGGERVVIDSDPNQYKFTGKERDTESGLDFFIARYYSSQYGRFLSTDWSDVPVPVPFADLDDPQSLNLYSYVRNKATVLTDANGHSPWWQKLRNVLKGNGWRTDEEVEEERKKAEEKKEKEADEPEMTPEDLQAIFDMSAPIAITIFTAAIEVTAPSGGRGGGAGAKGRAGAAGTTVAATRTPRMTQWGWSGSRPWRAAVNVLRRAGTHTATDLGKVPTRQEATNMIGASGGTINRIQGPHAAGGVSTHTYDHINYTTASGGNATVQIKP